MRTIRGKFFESDAALSELHWADMNPASGHAEASTVHSEKSSVFQESDRLSPA